MRVIVCPTLSVMYGRDSLLFGFLDFVGLAACLHRSLIYQMSDEPNPPVPMFVVGFAKQIYNTDVRCLRWL